MLADNVTVPPAGDGLVIDPVDDRLYITNNGSNRIYVLELSIDDDGVVSADLVGSIVSELYDSPSTSALYGNEWIYSVNARFASIGFPGDGEDDLTTFPEQFQVVAAHRKKDLILDATSTE
jgi:hypothetical protein